MCLISAEEFQKEFQDYDDDIYERDAPVIPEKPWRYYVPFDHPLDAYIPNDGLLIDGIWSRNVSP